MTTSVAASSCLFGVGIGIGIGIDGGPERNLDPDTDAEPDTDAQFQQILNPDT